MKLDNLSLKGTEITLKRSELAPTGSVLRKHDEHYDEFAKLVFMFDVSTSMDSRLAKTFTDQFVWTPALLTELRTKTEAAVAHVNRINCDPMNDPDDYVTDEETAFLKLSDPQRGPNGEVLFTADDEELKARVVQHNLINDFNIEVDWTKHTAAPPTRFAVMKKLAKSEVANRIKRFPKSSVGLVAFAEKAATMFEKGTTDELMERLERLEIGCAGPDGTTILAAVAAAVEVCRKHPSPVGVHRLILVSDGEDYSCSREIGGWVPNLKASGVVLDYIHIGDREPNEGVRRACVELGGECVTVNSERDFTTKFVEAVTRKMLPPAA